MQPAARANPIELFCNHPVAANLLMVMMLLAGFWSVKQLNTQFFPTFDINYVSVTTVWSGASASDMEELVTTALEQQLRDVDYVKEITSTSSESASVITLEFEENADMSLAVAQVKERVDLTRNLPSGSDTPEVAKAVNYEGITRLLVTGGADLMQLRALVNRFEAELLERGIAKIFITGLPAQQIAIEIPSRELRRLRLSLDDIGARISQWSRDAPLGVVGRAQTSRQLRFRERRTDELAFESVPIVAEAQGRLIALGAIAEIQRKPRDGQVSIWHRNQPAVEMSLNRSANSDSLKAARIFADWLADTRPTLPEGVELIPFDGSWELLADRIALLVKNGLSGLALVVLVLFVFMTGRVAWWTAVGIPVSFMAALAVFYLIGGSINMISLFGLIMALGIIVDDAIVVGEEAMSNYESGGDAQVAAQHAAQRMLPPVFSSSLTTISAFMPLLLVGGIIGAIMQAIPTVVICVIIASLIECFLILPGHLTHSFRRMGEYRPGRLRRRLDNAFVHFRERHFRRWVTTAVTHRWSTLAAAMALMIVTFGWLGSGRINFEFFPTAEADRLYANVGFVAGTPRAQVREYLDEIERALLEVETEVGEPLIRTIISRVGEVEGEGSGARGDHFGGVRAELTDPDRRATRNRDIIQAWRNKLPERAGLESLTVIEPRAGPPGRDIDLRIEGEDIFIVKRAAQQLQNILNDIPGVSGIGDDAPFGREQMVLELTPTAQALGLRTDNVARQLRAAFDGVLVQELSDGKDDIEVRLMLPARERNASGGLNNVSIVLPNGGVEPIANLATIRGERGFESIRHSDGNLAISVTAGVDPAVNNSNRIRAELEAEVLPQLAAEYGVRFSFGGRQADQAETLGDMQLGMLLALVLIYLVLAWVFGGYGWPLVVMFIIPFGIIGALWGHVVMGQDITVLSLFGFFALSGIVINDSIILVVRYQQLRAQGMPIVDAVIEAACMRLRAVLLTSLTTIGGLTPLLFETSLQAQFLIPMATTLAFGLGFATALVLLVIPALLLIYENAQLHIRQRIDKRMHAAPVAQMRNNESHVRTNKSPRDA